VVWDVDIREFGPENEFLCLIIFRLHCFSGTENEREWFLGSKGEGRVWLINCFPGMVKLDSFKY